MRRPGGPEELLGSLPGLLGWAPADVVLLVASAAEQPEAAVYRIPLTVSSAEALTRCGLAVADAVAARCTGAVVVVYADDAADPDADSAVTAATLVALAEQAGLQVLDALRVIDARWWSYECDDPSCCPPEGNPLPTPLRSTP